MFRRLLVKRLHKISDRMEAIEARLVVTPDESNSRVVTISRPDGSHIEAMERQRQKYNRCAAILDLYERRVIAKLRPKEEYTLS